MGSPKGLEKIDWYATPELQVTLCFCALTYDHLKQKYKQVNAQQFWRLLKHHIPHVEEYLPEHRRDSPQLVNWFFQRGDKLNRYDTEHPTHPDNKEYTGRFWEWAKERFNSTEGEFTLSKEQIERVIISEANGNLLTVTEDKAQDNLTDDPDIVEQPVEQYETRFIDFKQLVRDVDLLRTELYVLQDFVKMIADQISKR